MFEKNVSLKPYNTFGIEVYAERFATVTSITRLKEIIDSHKDVIPISGGSNILLTKPLKKPVIHLQTKGVAIIEEDDDFAVVEVQAGENWHEFVSWCMDRDLGGLENLSLIPGNAGTAPMQNIGAYGVEIKDVFYELDALEITSNRIKTFNKEACQFGYRESYFKKSGKNRYIITAVRFRLTKKNHVLHTSYGAIRDELEKMQVTKPGIRDVSEAVIAIRRRKLPDPAVIGNSGSFFKNPVIDKSHFANLQEKYPDIPFYPAALEKVKVPAGWLIDKLGYKGKRFGDAGVHQNQALVLVNYGKATGKDILNLAEKIQKDVREKYDILLNMEVNIL